MWKKNEETPTATPSAPVAKPRAAKTAQSSVIGPSIRIKGDLTGGEDLVIQGQLQGAVSLKSNNVTVGREGRIQADIHGRSVHVEGEVDGNLYGDQEVVIRASGQVKGNIISPRVVLENGSKFKGSIDMEPNASKAPTAPEKQAKKTAPAPGGASKPPVPAAAQPHPNRPAAGANRR